MLSLFVLCTLNGYTSTIQARAGARPVAWMATVNARSFLCSLALHVGLFCVLFWPGLCAIRSL